MDFFRKISVMFTLFFLVILISTATSATILENEDPIVEVEQGKIRGELVDLVTNNGQFYSFKGIPYVAPPVGNLRFKAPQPPISWDGIRNATQHGAVCPQFDIFTNRRVPGDEDCLFLNVYTKELNPIQPLPVMVFIHGGGYKSGSGGDGYYGADFLVQHGVVLVTINYRLDALGFLNLDIQEVPGNAGMKDQVAALKWVKKNIAQFGGDPDNVTIFGQSAGAAAVGLHVLSPLSNGLFKRSISTSGSPLTEWSLSFESRRHAFMLGRRLGIYTNDPMELLEKLQALPAETLVDVQAALFEFERLPNSFKTYFFTPVIEKDFGLDHFMTEEIEDTLNAGNINDVDVMLGHMSNEGATLIQTFLQLIDQYDQFPETLVPRSILMNTASPTVLRSSEKIRDRYFGQNAITNRTLNEFSTYISLSNFVYPVHKFGSMLPNDNDRSRYFYQFSYSSNRNVFSAFGRNLGVLGAGHTDEIAYLFDLKSFNMTVDINSQDYQVIDTICKLFTNFAKYGNPTPDDTLGVTWEQYDAEDPHYLDIGETLNPVDSIFEEELTFWDSVYEEAKEMD